MKNVVVVTDSSATVPARLVAELDIRVVPVYLTLEGISFRDGVDITPREVYRWQRNGSHQPTTAAPSVGDFLRVYLGAAENVSGIVSIHMSPALSAIPGAAGVAATLVETVPVRIVDCGSAAMGQGFVVAAAARVAAAGAGLEAVAQRAREVADQVHLLATIPTLEYLHRGGRVGNAAALVGSMLQIKPVLCVAEGHVDVFARPRTQSKAIRIMLQAVADQVDGRHLHAAILHADVPEQAEALRQEVAQRFRCAELYVTELTPVMGAHTGPGVLGVAFYADSEEPPASMAGD
jgi:DegV family protein with EDD domain